MLSDFGLFISFPEELEYSGAVQTYNSLTAETCSCRLCKVSVALPVLFPDVKLKELPSAVDVRSEEHHFSTALITFICFQK